MNKRYIHYYKVKLNKDHYFKKGSIYLDAVGTEEQTLPKHGEIVATPRNSNKYKEGDTVYFHSRSITHSKAEESNELFLYLREPDIIAAKINGEWHNGSMIVANRIKKPDPSSIIITQLKDQYYDQKFIRKDTGDRVWTYKDSDYIIDYEKEVAFLREEYIVYNETKQQPVGDWIILTPTDQQKWEKEGELYLPINKQKGRAKVAKPNKHNLTGEIIYQKSNYNKIQDTDYSCTQFKNIYGCYEKS